MTANPIDKIIRNNGSEKVLVDSRFSRFDFRLITDAPISRQNSGRTYQTLSLLFGFYLETARSRDRYLPRFVGGTNTPEFAGSFDVETVGGLRWQREVRQEGQGRTRKSH